MRFHMKKILSLLLSAVIILSGFCFAFADDPEDSSSGSSAEVFSFSDSELEFISQASDDDDLQLRQAAVIMAASSTYDIDDIYSILSSVRMIDNSRYVWATYDESVWSEVHNVYNKLITNSYNNTYFSVSELVAQLLSQFTSFSSFFYSPISGSASLWQLTDDIKTFVGLGLFDSQANPYLDLINSKIGTLTSSMTSGFNAVLSSVNSTTSAVNNTTNAVNATTNAVNNVVSSVDSFRSDFNNISWSDGTFYGVSLDTSNNYISSTSTAKDFYFHISIPTKTSYAFLETRISSSDFKMDVSSVSISGYTTSNFFPLTYKVVSTYPTLSLFIYFDDVVIRQSTSQHLLKISFNSNKSCSSNYGVYKLINFDSLDFYYIDNFMKLDRFTSIYASDDLLAAKQGQQSYEDQVINDFTGSGSASAKLSDAASAKDISSSVSSGLVSGASVNNTLSVFGTNSGFWGWFSQENSDLINTLSSQSQLRSSGSGSDWVIDDPYQRNVDELQSILGGNR